VSGLKHDGKITKAEASWVGRLGPITSYDPSTGKPLGIPQWAIDDKRIDKRIDTSKHGALGVAAQGASSKQGSKEE